MDDDLIRCAGCSRPLTAVGDICAWCDAEDANSEAALQRKLTPAAKYRCPGCGERFAFPEEVLLPVSRKWYQLQRFCSHCPLCSCRLGCRYTRRIGSLSLTLCLVHLLLPDVAWYFWHDHNLRRLIMLAVDMVLFPLILILHYRMSRDENRYCLAFPSAVSVDGTGAGRLLK